MSDQQHITPQLRRLNEFEEAIKKYKLNADAQKILNETPFVALSAPTASGRNTVINELLKTGKYYFVVSDTTRPPRLNDGVMEQNGVEYFFRNEDDMLEDIKHGRFIEAEVIHQQQVSGVSIREIEKAQAQSKIAITDMDFLGPSNVARLKPDVVAIFLVAPSFDEWLRRILKRTAVKPLELHRRMQTANRMFAFVLKSKLYTPVVNDDFQQTVKLVDDIAHGIPHPEAEARAREVVKELYAATVAYLRQHAPEFLEV